MKDFLDVLALEEVGPGRYRAGNLPGTAGPVFGGQILGQIIVAAARGELHKRVRSIHAIFARGGRPDQALEIDVDTMHSGRSFASATVTVRQGDRLCTRALVLLGGEEPDLIRHAAVAPVVGEPEAATALEPYLVAGELRAVGGVDLLDPDAVGPPHYDLWFRCPGAGSDQATNQAILADATDMFLIGTAMRPHRGVGQAMAHRSLDTGVVSHTLTFHQPLTVQDWHLLAHESPYAGGGRSYGRAHVFSRSGELVASFVQENMIRAHPAAEKH